MSRKARMAATTSIITNFKTKTSKLIDHRQKLLSLAVELQELYKPNIRLDIDFDANYFDCYCYVYLDPRKPGKYNYLLPSGKQVKFNYEPFYIGKGTGTRVDKHLEEARLKTIKSHKLQTIRNIWEEGFDNPIRITTASKVSECMALAFEVDLIAGIGRRDKKLGPLANRTDGGEGVSGRIQSQATKDKKRISMLTSPKALAQRAKLHKLIKGKKHSDEHRKRNSEARLGIPRSIESRLKQSASTKGKKKPPRTKKHSENNRLAQLRYWEKKRALEALWLI